MFIKLYHSLIKQPILKLILVDTDEKRDWRIYADFTKILQKSKTIVF